MTTPHSTAEKHNHQVKRSCRNFTHTHSVTHACAVWVFTLVGENRRPVDQSFERGALRLTDQSLNERLDVIHAVLHCSHQHPPEEAYVEQRSRPAPAHMHLKS